MSISSLFRASPASVPASPLRRAAAKKFAALAAARQDAADRPEDEPAGQPEHQADQAVRRPPVTARTSPVVKRDSSDARKT